MFHLGFIPVLALLKQANKLCLGQLRVDIGQAAYVSSASVHEELLPWYDRLASAAASCVLSYLQAGRVAAKAYSQGLMFQCGVGLTFSQEPSLLLQA